MPWVNDCGNCARKFQSAPGREAGRCASHGKPPPTLSRFQSAPGREAGRCEKRRNTEAAA